MAGRTNRWVAPVLLGLVCLHAAASRASSAEPRRLIEPPPPRTSGPTSADCLSAATTNPPLRLLAPAAAAPKAQPDPLAWDSLYKEFVAKTNDLDSSLEFNVTNVSSEEVIISRLRPSCGCTVAKMPATPWRLPPGAHGAISVSTDLRNKRGVLNKVVVVTASAGLRVLQMKITIPSESRAFAAQDRGQNLVVSLADPQAIFRGDCATCHVAPAAGKSGAALYRAACGICHDAERRATIVPALDTLRPNAGSNYWYRWTAFGKTNSLMPGFAQTQGGPLSEEQIQSLVGYFLDPTRESAK